MSFLGRLAAAFGFDYYGRYDRTNPVSPRLTYFFNYVVPKNPEMAELLAQYSDHPELRPSIYLRQNKNGDIIGAYVINKEKYFKIKKTL